MIRGEGVVSQREAQSFAQRTLTGPEATSHCFIDDNDRRRARSVLPGEFPPGDELNPHRREITRSYSIFIDIWVNAVRRLEPFDGDLVIFAMELQWNNLGQTG